MLNNNQKAKLGACILALGDVLEIYRDINKDASAEKPGSRARWAAIAAEARMLQGDLEREIWEAS